MVAGLGEWQQDSTSHHDESRRAASPLNLLKESPHFQHLQPNQLTFQSVQQKTRPEASLRSQHLRDRGKHSPDAEAGSDIPVNFQAVLSSAPHYFRMKLSPSMEFFPDVQDPVDVNWHVFVN
jgi:hypothetical protein